MPNFVISKPLVFQFVGMTDWEKTADANQTNLICVYVSVEIASVLSKQYRHESSMRSPVGYHTVYRKTWMIHIISARINFTNCYGRTEPREWNPIVWQQNRSTSDA